MTDLSCCPTRVIYTADGKTADRTAACSADSGFHGNVRASILHARIGRTAPSYQHDDQMDTENAKQVSRRTVREYAMQVLYAYELSGEPIEMLLESIAGQELEGQKEGYALAQRIIYSVLNHRPDADPYIRENAKQWEFERIATIDRTLLRMAICEFMFFADIPVKVTINEYVEIAKKYSTGQSGAFVNGILDAVLKQLREKGLTHKSGRGLIDL